MPKKNVCGKSREPHGEKNLRDKRGKRNQFHLLTQNKTQQKMAKKGTDTPLVPGRRGRVGLPHCGLSCLSECKYLFVYKKLPFSIYIFVVFSALYFSFSINIFAARNSDNFFCIIYFFIVSDNWAGFHLL